jgi:hypothetical protein
MTDHRSRKSEHEAGGDNGRSRTPPDDMPTGGFDLLSAQIDALRQEIDYLREQVAQLQEAAHFAARLLPVVHHRLPGWAAHAGFTVEDVALASPGAGPPERRFEWKGPHGLIPYLAV